MKTSNSQNIPSPSLITVLKPYRGLIAVLALLALLSNGVNLVIPQLISEAIDSVEGGAFSMKRTIFLFLAASLSIFVFQLLQGFMQTYVSEKVARDIRTDLNARISRQRYGFILSSDPSRLLTNLTSDVDALKNFVAVGIVSLVSSVFVLIGASVLLLSINWRLALNVLVVIPVIAGAFGFVFSKLRVLFKKNREVIDKLNKIINENIVGAALIRVLSSQTAEYDKFVLSNERARTIGMSILRYFAALIPTVVFVGNMASLAILVLGGRFVINGSMSLGDFAAFNSYLSILIFPIMVIGFVGNYITQASVSHRRIREVMDAPEQAESGTQKLQLTGRIRFDKVSLVLGDRPVLKSISFSLAPGSKTAIIGPTAAGKTQLLYVLTGLIDPAEGQVLFDEVPMNEIHKSTFRHQVGFVFQDSIIFNLTVRENIAFNVSVDEQRMKKAIRVAELQDFIESLPDGLETVISERGSNLSGGQKQRLMLARALALEPRVLLLDDFTARVDALTERKILANIQEEYPGITLLSITQKIAPVMDYDHILLIEEGELLAGGTHKELLHTSPEYVQLFNSQRSTNHYEL
ncbi:MAG: ABC transporter ATP-binding protein [Paludibacter sp.]|nr:ABC transporter ATP-binding protein [Paludibacter sp.]